MPLLTRIDARADTQCSTVDGEVMTDVSEILSRVDEARRLKYILDTAKNRYIYTLKHEIL
jgi:hypothetical protein